MTYELGSRVTPVNADDHMHGEMGTVVVDCGNGEIGVTWDRKPDVTGFWQKDPSRLKHVRDAPTGVVSVALTPQEAYRLATGGGSWVSLPPGLVSKGGVAYYGGLTDPEKQTSVTPRGHQETR